MYDILDFSLIVLFKEFVIEGFRVRLWDVLLFDFVSCLVAIFIGKCFS